MTDHEPSVKTASLSLSSDARLTTDAIVVEGEAQGVQTYSAERSKHELKAEAEAHKRRQESLRLEHDLEQERKDNDARRARETKDAKPRTMESGGIGNASSFGWLSPPRLRVSWSVARRASWHWTT